MSARPDRLRTAALALLALVGFAANSLLCRAALGGGGRVEADAASFTLVRLASGAAVLGVLSFRRTRDLRTLKAGSWPMALALFGYAIAFSFAYLRLSVGTGALLLFGAVQATMLAAGLRSGERLGAIEWSGFAVSIAGLVYLCLPGLSAPDPAGAALMLGAGVAWGVYSLQGRGASRPLLTTAANFARGVPLALAAALPFLGSLSLSPRGFLLASASGALASGVGYALWYAALPGLSATQAAIVQLGAPVLAAVAGVLLLAEPVSLRLVTAGGAILGGIALVVLARRSPAGPPRSSR
jgi:drug/metabolite transporter (DMT)-like permease